MLIRLKDWLRSLFQTIIILLVIILAFIVDFAKILAEAIVRAQLEKDSLPVWLRVIKAYGRWPLSLSIAVIVIAHVYNSNKEAVLNGNNDIYHEHTYFSYLFCRYVLGYKSCCLRLVPVPMQFKLVVNGVFANYVLSDDEIHTAPEDEQIDVKRPKSYTDTVNLMISDTYKVKNSQLPEKVKQYSAIRIDRPSVDHVRYDSEGLVKEVVSAMRNLPDNVKTVNVFATTNPVNTYHIAKEAFSTGERDSVKKIFAFLQNGADQGWKFKDNGIKIK